MLSLYVAEDSPLHRLSPGPKLLGLPVLAALLFASHGILAMLAANLAVFGLCALARIPRRVLASQLRVLAPLLLLFFLVQLFVANAEVAAVTVLRFLALVVAASLVTMTTRTSDMIASLEAALSRLAFLGVDAAKVSLAISLVLRFVPVIHVVLAEVREAQAARGRSASLFALAVPVILRTLKMADEIAEAIDARS